MKQHKGLVVILILALLLRLPHLNGSLWLDEAAQALESSRPLGVQYKIPDDFQPPLFHYLVHFELIVSSNEAWLRLVSLAAGLLSVALIYLLLRKVANENAAVVGGLLLAINPFAIFYSQELRPYALAMMFACLSWYALWTMVNGPIEDRKDGRRALVFVLATVGGLYSMYLYPFIIVSQLVYVFFERRVYLRTFILYSLCSILVFVPWLPFFFTQLHVGVGLTQSLPGWEAAVATPQMKALPLILGKFIVGQVEFKDSRVYYLLAGLALVISAGALVLAWKKKATRFLVYWLVIPILGTWVLSFIVPVIQPKRVIIALPALMAMLGILIMENGEWKILGRNLRRLASIVLISIFLFMDFLYFTVPKYQRENWRAVIANVQTQSAGKNSAAVFAFPDPFAPWQWYSKGSILATPTGRLHLDNAKQLNLPFRQLSGKSRIFVFDYLRDLTDPNHTIETWLSTSGYQQNGLIDGGNVGFVRIFDSR